MIIQDASNRSGFPTPDEIATLPRLARVAFAARWARRVLPLVKPREGAPSVPWNDLNTAVSDAERAAASPSNADRDSDVKSRPRGFWDPIKDDVPDGLLSDWNLDLPTLENDLRRNKMVDATVGSAAEVATAHRDALAFAARSDFDRIAGRAIKEGWNDDTPVPPDVFGPLWPHGAPDGWPADEAK